jgi:hypothetical protein
MPGEEFCWTGPVVTDGSLPIDPGPTPVTLRLTSGALRYDDETVFLSFVGTAEIDAECEGRPAGQRHAHRHAVRPDRDRRVHG